MRGLGLELWIRLVVQVRYREGARDGGRVMVKVQVLGCQVLGLGLGLGLGLELGLRLGLGLVFSG